MDRAVFDRMDAQEEVHWWFRARRTIIQSVIARFIELPDNPRLMEAGCGTGGNLEMLGEFGALRAFELDDVARAAAAAKSGLAVAPGALPGPIPFEAERFDLIGLFDVLEHVEEDQAALAALTERLSAEGRILLTVPAFQWLWSAHDEHHHHFRRYNRAQLAAVAKRAGLTVERSFYFNTLLFPVAVVLRALKRWAGSTSADDTLPGPLLNAALHSVFAFERFFVGRVTVPVGLSLCAVLKRA